MCFLNLLLLILPPLRIQRRRQTLAVHRHLRPPALKQHPPLCKYTINNLLQTSNKCWFGQKQTPDSFQMLLPASRQLFTVCGRWGYAPVQRNKACSCLTAVLNPRSRPGLPWRLFFPPSYVTCTAFCYRLAPISNKSPAVLAGVWILLE